MIPLFAKVRLFAPAADKMITPPPTVIVPDVAFVIPVVLAPVTFKLPPVTFNILLFVTVPEAVKLAPEMFTVPLFVSEVKLRAPVAAVKVPPVATVKLVIVLVPSKVTLVALAIVTVSVAPGTAFLFHVAGVVQFPLTTEINGISEDETPTYKGPESKSVWDTVILCAPGVIVPFWCAPPIAALANITLAFPFDNPENAFCANRTTVYELEAIGVPSFETTQFPSYLSFTVYAPSATDNPEVTPAASLYTTASSPATPPVALVLEMYIALFAPAALINGYLLVAFVGSVPAVTDVPVAAAVHHLENLPPDKKPVPTGAVRVPPAAPAPKVILFVPKLTLAPVRFKLLAILTSLISQLIFGVAVFVLLKVKFRITPVLNVPEPLTVCTAVPVNVSVAAVVVPTEKSSIPLFWIFPATVSVLPVVPLKALMIPPFATVKLLLTVKFVGVVA
ncbi:hypothetical protein D3C86_1144430 [compost metagenome]